MLAALVGDVVELYETRKKLLKRMELLQKRLDPQLIKSLDNDGGGVTKLEFVIGAPALT